MSGSWNRFSPSFLKLGRLQWRVRIRRRAGDRGSGKRSALERPNARIGNGITARLRRGIPHMQPNVMRLGRVRARTGMVPRKRLSMPALLARPRGAPGFPGINAVFAMAGILRAGLRAWPWPGGRFRVRAELLWRFRLFYGCRPCRDKLFRINVLIRSRQVAA